MTKLWTSEQSQSIKKWVIKSTGDVDNEVVLEMSRYKRIRVTPNSGKKLLFINNYDFFQNAILARPFNSKIIKLQCLITFTFHFTKPRSLNSISQQSPPQKPFAHLRYDLKSINEPSMKFSESAVYMRTTTFLVGT